MARIKRNLFFVIGAVAALVLIGFVVFHSFPGPKHNAGRTGELKAADAEPQGSRSGNPPLDNTDVAAAPAGKSNADEGPTLTLRCRAVIPSHASGDAETAIAYALQNELRASMSLFNPQTTKLGPEIHRDGNADTFTFDVTLGLKRPLKL